MRQLYLYPFIFYTSKIFLVWCRLWLLSLLVIGLALLFRILFSLVSFFPTVEQSVSIIRLWWSKYCLQSMFFVRTAKKFILRTPMWLCLVRQSFFLPMIGLHLFEQYCGCCNHRSELGCPRILLIDITFVASSEHFISLWFSITLRE